MAACGTNSTVFLGEEGSVWCIGRTQIKQQYKPFGATPKRIPELKDIVDIASSLQDQFAALDSTGNVWYNDTRAGWKKISNLTSIVSVVFSNQHLLCLDSINKLWKYNRNSCNQKPLLVSENVKEVAAYSNNYLYLREDNSLFITNGSQPQEYKSELPNISSVACGNNFAFISNGKCYYFTYYGNAEVVPNVNAKAVYCAGNSIAIIDQQNELWCLASQNQPGIFGNTNFFSKVFTTTNPTKIVDVGEVTAVALGAQHMIVKSVSGEIYAFGNSNSHGQLGLTFNFIQTEPQKLPKEFENLFIIPQPKKLFKEAMNWTQEEVDDLIEIEKFLTKQKKTISNMIKSNKHTINAPPRNIITWKAANEFLTKKIEEAKQQVAQSDIIKQQNKATVLEIENEIIQLELRLKELKKNLPDAIKKRNKFCNAMENIDKALIDLNGTKKIVNTLFLNEKSLNSKLEGLFRRKTLKQFCIEDVSLVLWKIDLCYYQEMFRINKVNGDILCDVNEASLLSLGMKSRDASCLLFHRSLMLCPGYVKTPQKTDCIICFHDTPELTVDLLQEHEIPIDEKIILRENWLAGFLIYGMRGIETQMKYGFVEHVSIQRKLCIWQTIHERHLSKLLNI